MSGRHSRPVASTPRVRGRGRARLMIVVLAPALVLAPLAAWAANGHVAKAKHGASAHHKAGVAKATKTTTTTAKTKTTVKTAATAVTAAAAVAPHSWARSWSPALALLIKSTTKVGYTSLSLSMHAGANQKAVATARFKTNWVDTRALKDGPNVMQQGLSIQPMQYKLQVMHGPNPSDHRANCHIQGTTGHILAFGPRIDVADGRWHTITCVKYADTARGTKVVVYVDGVAGPVKWSKTPIGNVLPTGLVRLGGRGPTLSSDSLDGWISKASFKTG
jgi:hypothetical protein